MSRLQHADIADGGRLPGMPVPAAAARRGRRGRRTGAMIRIAQDRVLDLFALAEAEAARGPSPLADRYVSLARKVGTRYNVRLPRELGERYCRGCSSFWVEGRNVRTRIRGGRRVRTCLVCGRVRRIRWGDPGVAGPTALPVGGPGRPLEAVAPVEAPDGSDEDLEDGLDE